MKKYIALLAGICVLSSCASAPKPEPASAKCPPPVKREAKFIPEQYAPYAGQGTAKINGRLCVKDTAGETKCLANQLVVANPVTDYSTEWFERHWSKGVFLEPPLPEARKHTRTVKTDAQGYFSFTDLKPGSYYVGAVVCPPCIKGKQPYKYQRLGAKVTMKKSVKADLKPLYTP